MAAYENTPGDVEEASVVLVERRRSAGCMWRLSGALLLLLLLCLGAALLAWYFRGGCLDATDSAERTQAQSSSDRPDLHQTLNRISSGATAAIHLEGRYDDEDGRGGGITGAGLQWRKDQGQAFDQGGFNLSNNSVLVPKTGLYFVYSQASFRVPCSEDGGGESAPTPLSHRIWRYSDSVGGKASLMSAVRSACQNDGGGDGRGWYNAVYLGAVFQLQRDDRLWTETNPLARLETDEGKTFFGVFAL
ncbi:unnamed protein product [Ophioblennius macclurei]